MVVVIGVVAVGLLLLLVCVLWARGRYISDVPQYAIVRKKEFVPFLLLSTRPL